MTSKTKPLASREVVFYWEKDDKLKFLGRLDVYAGQIVVSGRNVNYNNTRTWAVFFGAVGALVAGLIQLAFSEKKEIVFDPSTGQVHLTKYPLGWRFEIEPERWLFCQSNIPRPGPKYERFVQVLEQLYQERLSKD